MLEFIKMIYMVNIMIIERNHIIIMIQIIILLIIIWILNSIISSIIDVTNLGNIFFKNTSLQIL